MVFSKPFFFNAKVGKERKEGEVGKKLKEVDREVDREVEKLTENQKMILELIRKNPHVSKLEMSKVIGIRVSSIEKNITTLEEKSFLRREGTAKGGHWKLIKNIII